MKKATKKSHGLTVTFTGVEDKTEGDKKYNVYNLSVAKEGASWTLQKRRVRRRRAGAAPRHGDPRRAGTRTSSSSRRTSTRRSTGTCRRRASPRARRPPGRPAPRRAARRFPAKQLGQLSADQMASRRDGLKAWFDEFLAMAITPRVLQQTCSRVPALR